jgi:hypothetical protein
VGFLLWFYAYSNDLPYKNCSKPRALRRWPHVAAALPCRKGVDCVQFGGLIGSLWLNKKLPHYDRVKFITPFRFEAPELF